MSKQIDALKLAEESLEGWKEYDTWTDQQMWNDDDEEALAAIREALAEQALQNLSDFHQHMEATEPEYYDCGGTIGVVHKSQCSAAMKRNGKPMPEGFRLHNERMAEIEADPDKREAIEAARNRLRGEPVKQEPVAFKFVRYVNGKEMAEGVTIERETTLDAAIKKAVSLCPDRAKTVLVYAAPLDAKAIREVLAKPELNLNCKSVQARLATVWGYVKAEPVCKRCNGTKLVSDGEIDNIGGVDLEVPIECVKDCPDCAKPVKHSEHYWLHEINNARADGYERGYMAAKKLYAEPVKQEPVSKERILALAKQERVLIPGLIGFQDSLVEFARVMAEEVLQSAAPVQPVKQEPVAWKQIGIGDCEGTTILVERLPTEYNKEWWRFEPLYAAPVSTKREWVDLTDDEIVEADKHSHGNTEWAKKKAFASAVISAFREKSK